MNGVVQSAEGSIPGVKVKAQVAAEWRVTPPRDLYGPSDWRPIGAVRAGLTDRMKGVTRSRR